MQQYITAAIIIIAIFSCTSARDNANANRLNGEWELIAFSLGDKPFAELFSTTKPTLQFDASTKRISGNAGCNRISGSYHVKGNVFQVGDNLATTKMACPGYDESVFLSALQRINRHTFNNSQLNLYNDSSLLMTLARK